MRRVFLAICVATLSLSIAALAYCAEAAKQTSKSAPMVSPVRRPMVPQMDKNFVFVLGAISKVDATAPGNTKVEVMNEVDNKIHVIEVGPGTNILKVIDAAELKTGEKIRVMARKADDKEVAMSIVTGKLKEMPRQKTPVTQVEVPAPSARPQGQIKK